MHEGETLVILLWLLIILISLQTLKKKVRNFVQVWPTVQHPKYSIFNIKRKAANLHIIEAALMINGQMLSAPALFPDYIDSVSLFCLTKRLFSVTNLFLHCSASSLLVVSSELKHPPAALQPDVHSPPRPRTLSVQHKTHRLSHRVCEAANRFKHTSCCCSPAAPTAATRSFCSLRWRLSAARWTRRTWHWSDKRQVTWWNTQTRGKSPVHRGRTIPVFLHGEVITCCRERSRHLPVRQLLQ